MIRCSLRFGAGRVEIHLWSFAKEVMGIPCDLGRSPGCKLLMDWHLVKQPLGTPFA
jgi:hypothetical protein